MNTDDSKAMFEKQHAKGKLHALERLALLFDGSEYRELTDEQSRDGVIVAFGTVQGKPVVAASQDFTHCGGSLGLAHGKNIAMGLDFAVIKQCPFVAINDSGGARIQEGIDALMGYGGILYRNVRMSGYVPQYSVIVGPCAGGAVYSPGISDFIFLVDEISQMYVTGPKIVCCVTREEVSAQQLGGTEIHSQESGVAHFRFTSEQACFEQLRYIITLLPKNNADVQMMSEQKIKEQPEFSFVMPSKSCIVYEVRSIIRCVVDVDSFLEVAAEFARSIVIGFARLNGLTIGLVCNQPSYMAGVLDCDSSDKAARFVRFCDAFGIPIITFTDVPGYMPGKSQEKEGIIRHGAKLLYAFAEATVPRINVILRKAYGGAYIAMNSKHLGADYVYAWPTAEVAVMGEQGAVEIIYAKYANKMSANEKQTFLKEKAEAYRKDFMNYKHGLAKGYIDELIQPEDTRQCLIAKMRELTRKNAANKKFLKKKHGNIPL